MSNKTFFIKSLGCFRNTYDAKTIMQEFLLHGYRYASTAKKIHTLVINTCGFIDSAKEESINAIKEALQLKENKQVENVIVAGCLSQRYQEELKKYFPQVTAWRGILPIDKLLLPNSKAQPTEFLKISEGCLNKCSYCAIPLIKGPLQSRSVTSIVEEARAYDRNGVKELIIIGQDISSFGYDTKEAGLVSLIKKLLHETRIPWIRLLYLHPKHLGTELLRLIAHEKRICKYIDLPIQHIHDRILKLMNRGVSSKELTALVERIRMVIPGCVLRTSVIVGFPTETEKEFKMLFDFVRRTRFERLGVFAYSREENTIAFSMRPQVASATKKRRLRELMSLQKETALECNARFIGKKINVLVEEKEKDFYIGRSQLDAPEVDGAVYIKRKGLKVGQFYTTTITDSLEYDLIGI